MTERPIYITTFDRDRLIKLILQEKHSDYRKSRYLENLEQEVARAKVVAPTEIPADTITMNSQAFLVDADTGEEETVTLVFPEDADISQGKVSILAPVGTGMLGYRVGDVFDWQVPDGVRRLKVVKILFQPEASGNFDL